MPGKEIDITRRERGDRVTVSKQGLEVRRTGKPVSSIGTGSGCAYLVIDCSWSMEGAELGEAKRGAIDFAREALAKGYSVGLIRFASSASHLCEPERDVGVLRRHLEALEAEGTTDMAEGIRLATSRLRNRTKPRVAVVATDGMPDSKEDALAAAHEAKRNGVGIITIGTELADREFLRQIASRTELAVMVSKGQLGRGIASSARMLPEGNPNRGT